MEVFMEDPNAPRLGNLFRLDRTIPVRKLPVERKRRLDHYQRAMAGMSPTEVLDILDRAHQAGQEHSWHIRDQALIYNSLSRAQLYYATEDFCRLISMAYPGIDVSDETELDLHVPSMDGWMYLAEPIHLDGESIDGNADAPGFKWMDVRWLQWGTWKIGEGPSDAAIAFWMGGLNDEGDESCARVTLMKDDETGQAGFRGARGKLSAKLIVAAWSLTGQEKLVTHEDREPEAHTIRKHRMKPEEVKVSTVTVVNLRRSVQQNIHEAKELAADEAQGRHYSHRHLVGWPNGIWKMQPCGPKNSQRRRIYVEPYVRGPKDAPFIQKTKVYQV